MLRKIVLGAATLAAVVVPLALTASAEAGAYRQRSHYPLVQHSYYGHGHHCHFKVLYRDCYCGSWSCYGTFHSRCEADQIACSLRYQGYETRVASF